MTEKLYYKDAYIKEFSATVTGITENEGVFAVTLDRTAFFPEEGGQSADTGELGGISVKDVKEIEGVIYHYLDEPLELGATVTARLDFATRFAKMQVHSAEHIISGIIHRLYGFDNVGFHLGEPEVTMDINGVLTREQLDEVEDMANAAVFRNVPIRAYFPTEDELKTAVYRSKLDLAEGIRLVEIGEYDVCACCAPHVAYTGEIGLIKILDFEKHKGGLRIYITAGERALLDYRTKYGNVRRISALLSEPQVSVADAVSRLLIANEELRAALKAERMRLAALKADAIPRAEGNSVVLYPDMTVDELRELCNSAVGRIGGLLVALSGTDGDYKYVIMSEKQDVSRLAKDINSALSGRGGGRGNMIQGSFYTDLDTVKAYFK